MTHSGEVTKENGRGEEGDARTSSAEALSGEAEEARNAKAYMDVYQASMGEQRQVKMDVYQGSVAELWPAERYAYQASMAEPLPVMCIEKQSSRKAAVGLQTGSLGDAISSIKTGHDRDEVPMAEVMDMEEQSSSKAPMGLQINGSMGDAISCRESGQIQSEEASMAEPGQVMDMKFLQMNGPLGDATISSTEIGQLGRALNSSHKAEFCHSSGKKARILSIDGGGMRGIIPAKVLCYVEERLKQKTGNPGARIVDFFDIVVGTSVGGLIATMLCMDAGHGQPLFSAHEAWKLIAEKGKLIFKVPPLKRPFAKLRGILTPRYSVKNMELILKEYLVKEDGQYLTLKDALKPLLIPCYNLMSADTLVFSRADARKGDSHNYRLMDVCRATSAVPGFFKPAIFSSLDGKTSIIGIDGGLVMNNPAAAAVAHVLHNTEEFPYVHGVGDTLVLSLGTGLFDRSYKAKKVKRWGAFQWAKPIAKIVLDGISDMVDHSMSMAFSHHSWNYVRIQVSGLPSRCLTEMDDASSSNVRRLTKIADNMLSQPCMQHIPFAGRQKLSVTNRERLDSLVDCLIAEQRSRLVENPSPS